MTDSKTPGATLFDELDEAPPAKTAKPVVKKKTKSPDKDAPAAEAPPAKAKSKAKPKAEQAELPVGEAEVEAQAAADAPPPQAAGPKEAKEPGRRASADEMASRQREISVAEFFTKNRHLLGFDSPLKALLTAVKEAVDNSLDACEEAGILPELIVEISPIAEDRFRVAIEDNGPGIVQEQIGRVFGKLLYGSKFHRLKQSRGQQGIGISAAAMYAQLTTGAPIRVTTRTGKGKPAHFFEIQIDTRKNNPVVTEDRELGEWTQEHGTRVELEIVANWQQGQRFVNPPFAPAWD